MASARENIPAELRALPRWVARGADKKPYTAAGRLASSTDEKTWLAFDAASALADQEGLAGVGFVFNGDGIAGVDLDHCRDATTGALEAWAQTLIDRLQSYTEISPSGEGLHVFVRATLPGPGRKKHGAAGGAIECYDRARYFTVTGQHLEGTPTTIEPRQDIVADLWTRLGAPAVAAKPADSAVEDHTVLARAFEAKNGAKVLSLYRGELGEHGSGSEADQALAASLAYWTRDAAQLERLMRGSRLVRDKWDERRPGGTWLSENVIAKAIALTESTHRALGAHALEVRFFDTIEPEELNWLWPKVIPYGMLTLFVGDPGYGKSMLTLEVAACVSSGRILPDGTNPDPGNVLLVFCEDSAGITVRPRLEAAEATLSRIGQLWVPRSEEVLNIADDLPRIRHWIETYQTKLLVLDPVNAYLPTKANSWRDADVRQVLTPLAALAEETGCAILGIMHLNKTLSSNALHRVTGSIAFTGVARSVYLIGPHPEDKSLEPAQQRKVFAPVKMNLCAPPKGREFRIVGSEDRPTIQWGSTTSQTAEGMLAAQVTGVTPDGKLEEAVAQVRELLKDGARPASELFELLKAKGLSEATIRRAKKAADVISTQEGSDGKNRHIWRLADDEESPF